MDKSLTFNIWSCGLDLSLHTWNTPAQRSRRLNLINYAIHDLLAPTSLFHYIERTKLSSNTSVDATQSNNIPSTSSSAMFSFLVITDSHGKFLPPVTTQADYTLTITAVPGLQWINPHNTRLCCKSSLLSSVSCSLISASCAILFIVGSNSVRTTEASVILVQIEEIINLLRSTYYHPTNRASISISYIFPSFKPSSQYPMRSLLASNIQAYNEGLHALSLRKEFSVVYFPMMGEHLSPDGLHIRTDYLFILYDNIHEHFTNFIKLTSATLHSKCRSRAAIKLRNRRRHDKFKIKQETHTLIRTIARVWHLHELKQYLKQKYTL